MGGGKEYVRREREIGTGEKECGERRVGSCMTRKKSSNNFSAKNKCVTRFWTLVALF
jgi:hypothetical protein